MQTRKNSLHEHFFTEISEIKNHLFFWLWSFLVVSSIVFSVGIGKVYLMGVELYVPIFSHDSLAVMLFRVLKENLVPQGVTLVAVSPLTVFLLQTKIAFLIAFLITLPIFLYKIFRYASPAFYAREKRFALSLIIPSILLFVSGAMFAYFILVPPTFRILYSFNEVFSVASFFSVDEFINWTLAVMIATGILFLLPILMYLLSLFNFVSSTFWRSKWRVSLIIFLIVAAIITPDPSGLTMFFIALPMILLYGVGIGLSMLTKRR